MGRVWRHIKDGITGVTRHFALSLSSISSVTVTLLLMSIFLFLSVNISTITRSMEQSVQIHAQISNDFEEKSQINEIQKHIEQLPEVLDVKFSSKENELDAFIRANDSEDAESLYGGYRGENNPMLNAFLINAKSGDEIKDLSNKIAKIEGVYKTSYGGSGTTDFLGMLEQVRNVGFIIVVTLAVIAVFLISNTIRVSIHSRRREISIMRTVGATNWYIRWPFIIEGMVIGLLGAIIPIVISIFGYQYLYQATGGILISQMFKLVAVYPLSLQISGILALIGIVVGALGSLFSVGKFLRWSR